MSELFSVPKKSKQNEYQKAYSMVYAFTDNEKLQMILLDYVKFRVEVCKDKGYRFYSSTIKSFLQTIVDKMSNNTDDEVWDAVNLTLSYGAMRLLIPYNNSSSSAIKNKEGFTTPNIENDGLNHNKSAREF